MTNTTRLGLVVYAQNDPFTITGDTNSLNNNMQILDENVLPLDATWGDIEEDEEDEE